MLELSLSPCSKVGRGSYADMESYIEKPPGQARGMQATARVDDGTCMYDVSAKALSNHTTLSDSDTVFESETKQMSFDA